MTQVAVVGAGYVGLTSAACFASLGHDVVCADIDPDLVHQLQSGEVAILETGLENLVRAGLGEGRLRFVVGAPVAVEGAEIVYLCVPTPQGDDGSADISYIVDAATGIAPHLGEGAIVVNKSTVPVGTAARIAEAIGRPDIQVVSNPEFLREGSAVHDFLHPDRVVIGASDPAAGTKVAGLYLRLAAPVLVTDTASAETIKYAANSFLAAKVSFANAIAAVCEAVGADVHDVLLGVGHDRRIGREFLEPGPGWGGSCFPKDVNALVKIAEEAGYDFGLLRGVLRVNDEQRDRIVGKVAHAVGGNLEGARIAAWGLTFKAGTDDLRESPALRIIRALQQWGAVVTAYDPAITEARASRPALEGIDVVHDPYAACENAGALVVLTEWDEFRWLELAKVKYVMAEAKIIDARNLLDPSTVVGHGIAYEGIGRA